MSADNNVMHAKPDLRVFLEWMIARSGSVITDVIRLQKLHTFMNGNLKKRRFRFSIRSALLGLFGAAILLWVLGPASLRVHFGDLEHHADQPDTYFFTLKNYGPLPIYYRYAEIDDNFMVTRLDADSTTPLHEGHKYAPWTALGFLGETRVHEKYLKNGTRVGIQFRDIFGIHLSLIHI